MNLAAADFSQIPMSQNLAATLARASDAANAIGSAEVGLEHVLLSLCHDPDAEAVLMASRVDVARLQAETAQYLGAQPNHPSSGVLGVAPALTRILEAAAAAARGSRRRDINGAIVLAAIVGDGKSVAAQILQAYGLTFDEAIRALQAALAPPSRDPIPDMRPADDVLARARERVHSRSAPSLRDIMSDAPRPALPPPTPNMPAGDYPQLPPPGHEVDHTFGGTGGGHADAGSGNAAEQPPLREVVASAPLPEISHSAPPVGYSYPTGQPEPPPAPVPMRGATGPYPEQERSISFDLSRPVPISMPPPIPPPYPQHGAPQGYPPAHPPAHPQGGFAPMGAPPMQPQYGGNPYGQMAPPPPSAPSMQMPPPGARTGAPPESNRKQRPKAETGQLAENIPRGMRVGVTERVEIRIAKASVKAITEGLEGGGVAWRHEMTVTQAMSVRLRAPDGGFFIETVSPETQWIENHLGFASDDFASWRFMITPQTRGWAQLADRRVGAHHRRGWHGGRNRAAGSGCRGEGAHQLQAHVCAVDRLDHGGRCWRRAREIRRRRAIARGQHGLEIF